MRLVLTLALLSMTTLGAMAQTPVAGGGTTVIGGASSGGPATDANAAHTNVSTPQAFAGPISASNIPYNPQPVPGSLTAGTVTVSPSVVGYIPGNFLGLFYSKNWMTFGPNTAGTSCFFCVSNTRALGSFQHLGPLVLRLGTNENVIWTPAGAGSTANQLAPADVTNFAAFIKACGCKVIYGLNFTNSATDVAEATAVANALGSSLLGWEIGNEPDGIGGATTPASFASGWNTIALAVQAAVPGVPFTGPATGVATNVTTWTAPFMATNSSLVSLITQHFYINGNTSLVAELLENQATNGFYTGMISQMNTLRGTNPQPWRLAETNNFFGGGSPGVSNSYAAALFAVDYLFTCALQGTSGVNISSGGIGSNGTLPYTPISDNQGVTFGPTPEYAGLYLFSLATSGQAGQMLSTSLSASGVTLANAYTVQNSTTGAYSTVIVNKDTTHNLAITLTLPQAIQSANVYLLTDAAGVADQTITNIQIQGAPFDQTKKDGSIALGAPYTATIANGVATIYLPAASAAVVQSIAPAVVPNTPLNYALSTPSGAVSTTPATVQSVSINGGPAQSGILNIPNLVLTNTKNTITSPTNAASSSPMYLLTTLGVTQPTWGANTYLAIDALSSTNFLIEAAVNAANVMNLQYTTGAGASLLLNTGGVTATPTSILFRFSNNGSSKLALNGAGTLNLAGTIDMFTRAVTVAADTATVDDSTIRCNAATQAETETLPAAPVTGEWFYFKKVDATANTCTLSGNGKNIDGGTTIVLSTQFAAARLQYNGTNWDVF